MERPFSSHCRHMANPSTARQDNRSLQKGCRSEKSIMCSQARRSIRDRMRRAALIVMAAGAAVWGSAVHAADPIKLGFSMPLTGGLASNGKAILTTYQMWQEDINAKG